jgi:hypothetical protein
LCAGVARRSVLGWHEILARQQAGDWGAANAGHRIEFPEEYDSEAFIWKSKGFIYVMAHFSDGESFVFCVIDRTRLLQEVQGASGVNPCFESNLVVIGALLSQPCE